MADICELILEEHHELRQRFAQLDVLQGKQAEESELVPAWEPLATLLDRHADAEERLFYPRLLGEGDAGEETKDAIRDHNDIRDAVERARRCAAGTQPWWEAVEAARRSNSEHMAEEEREALADFRRWTGQGERHVVAVQWMEFTSSRSGLQGVDRHNKDPERFVNERS